MLGGLLKIVFSIGWFSIILLFAINVFLRSCTAWWYVVTKGNVVSLYFFAFVLASIVLGQSWLQRCFYILFRIPVYFEAFKVRKALIKCRCLKVCLKLSYCLAFNEASFYPRRVAQGEVGILKGFSRLIVGFHVQDGFLRESLSFENCCIK